MGCGSINKPNQSIWYNAFSGLFRYRVKVLLEDSSILDFIHEDQFDEMPVTAVMNIIAFNSENFVFQGVNFLFFIGLVIKTLRILMRILFRLMIKVMTSLIILCKGLLEKKWTMTKNGF